MKKIAELKNTVQEYAWGSLTAIPALLQTSPSWQPQAELWMGAHPKAPSMVKINGGWRPLPEQIEKNPEDILGRAVAEKFSNRLPYLFKVLAAAKPLSIQAHPNARQAEEGFERENALGIALDAPERNFKDRSHKPECLCALSTFWALCGFRKIPEILSLMRAINPPVLNKELDALKRHPDPAGLKRFYSRLMHLKGARIDQLLESVMQKAHGWAGNDPVFEWIIRIEHEYPGDIGVLSPLLLNLICLHPGQAVCLTAGQLHAYLEGVGIELMANSDNVLRGGLTPKHVDVPQLLQILNFQSLDVKILQPRENQRHERIYTCPADEFMLAAISLKAGMQYHGPAHRSVEILLCTRGEARLDDYGGGDAMRLTKGESVLIPAAVKGYSIEGPAELYKAAVPV